MSKEKTDRPGGTDGKERTADTMRLNRFIARAGVCTRREADQLILNGEVKVNGSVVNTLGSHVALQDKVEYAGAFLSSKIHRYVLLNKPKDHHCDKAPRGSKTVQFLIRKATKESIRTVDTLERDTTGLLLLTNDSEMSKRLMQANASVEQLYHITLEKEMSEVHLNELRTAKPEHEDTLVVVDAQYVGRERKELGMRIRAAGDKPLRKMIGLLGYRIDKLDRVMFAGLTKKDLDRGRWRHLSEKEIGILKRTR